MNCIKNERIKNEIIKNERIKNERIKNELIKKELIQNFVVFFRNLNQPRQLKTEFIVRSVTVTGSQRRVPGVKEVPVKYQSITVKGLWTQAVYTRTYCSNHR